MNKNLFLNAILFLIAFYTQAQVVFNYTDYAAQNDTFRISKADSLWTTNFDTSGYGITWDYSTLTAYTQTVEKVIAPNASGYIFTPVSFQNTLDRAEPISDTLYIGSIELSNTYNFFDLTSTQYKHVARASEIEGVEMKTKFDSSDVVYTFPMQYGNAKDSSNSGYTISVGSILYYTHTQKRVNEIEGEGTLVTPFGTFSALKLKSTVYSTDSFSIDTFGIPQYSYTTIEYKWFSPDYGYPLLEVSKEIISGVTISVNARYLDSIRYFVPSALFAYYPETPVQGQEITFQNLSSNASSYNWDFGDGNTSTDVNPTHTYTDTGTFNVQLISLNPTSADTFNLPVVVTDSNAIISYFTYTPQYPCYGYDTIVFVNTSYNATSYLWDFGDGNTSIAVDTSYVYATPGTYTVKLIAYKSGASDTMETQIKYALLPSASFTLADSVVTSPVVFTNTTTGTDTATTYYWDFGFGASPSTSTEKNPIVTYSFAGDKTVYLIAYNSAGCSSTYVKSIEVAGIDSNSVVSYFSYQPESACEGDTISFNNKSYNATSYLWNFGDGQIDSTDNAFHAYDSAGTYTVSLVASDGVSSDSTSMEITIASIPTASFSVPNSIYVGDTVVFSNLSTNTDSTSTYYWEFGVDASPFSSTDQNPSVSYSSAGSKTISLTVSNSEGCYSISSTTVTVDSIISGILYTINNPFDRLIIYDKDQNSLYVQYNLSEKSQTHILIYNMMGKRVYSQNIPIQDAGEYQLSIPFNKRGFFIMELYTNSGKTSKKFIKK